MYRNNLTVKRTSPTPSCNGPPHALHNSEESYNINHNITTRHCSFEYALHIHDVIYEGAF